MSAHDEEVNLREEEGTCRPELEKVATVAGLIAGGDALGAGLGILFAPQAGADSRRAMRGYTQRAQDGASRFGQQVAMRVSHAIHVSRSFMKDGEEKAA